MEVLFNILLTLSNIKKIHIEQISYSTQSLLQFICTINFYLAADALDWTKYI
jgi:hypothetical protein